MRCMCTLAASHMSYWPRRLAQTPQRESKEGQSSVIHYDPSAVTRGGDGQCPGPAGHTRGGASQSPQEIQKTAQQAITIVVKVH